MNIQLFTLSTLTLILFQAKMERGITKFWFLVSDSNSSISCSLSVSPSVRLSVRFCDIISNHCIVFHHSTHQPQVVQCAQFCTVSTFWIWLVQKGPTGCTVCTVLYNLYILKLIGPKGTHRLCSVNSFVQFEHFETDWSWRDPQVVQCVHFETDWSQKGPPGCTVCTVCTV